MPLPIAAYKLVPGKLALPGNGGQEFMRRLAVVKRRNEGLNNGGCPIVSASIAPGFQVMRLGDVPVADRRGFVFVVAKMKPRVDLQNILAKVQIRGRVID